MAKPDTPTTEPIIQSQAAHEWSHHGLSGTVHIVESVGISGADREIHDKAAAYDAFLDALGDDMDRKLAEINATLDRLAA